MTHIIFDDDDFTLGMIPGTTETGVVFFPQSSKHVPLPSQDDGAADESWGPAVYISRKKPLKLDETHGERIATALSQFDTTRWVAFGSKGGALDALRLAGTGRVAGAVVMLPAKPVDEDVSNAVAAASGNGARIVSLTSRGDDAPDLPGARVAAFSLHGRQLSAMLEKPSARQAVASALLNDDHVGFSKAVRASRLDNINTYKPLLKWAANDTARILKITEIGLRYLPEDEQLVPARARALEAAGRADEALDLLATAYQANPGNSRVAITYSNALEGAGRMGDALSVMEASLVQNHDLGTSKRLINLLTSAGRHDDAIARLKDAMNENPDAPALQALADKLMPETTPAETAGESFGADAETLVETAPEVTETKTSTSAHVPQETATAQEKAGSTQPRETATPARKGLKGLLARIFS